MNFIKFCINSFPKYMSNERGTMAWIAIGTAVVAGGYTAYSSYQQGAASKAFQNYQAQQQEVDAQAAYAVGQAQSQQVAQQGEITSQTLAFKNAQEIGKMRADESANGITANSVTAENLEVNSFNKGNRDESILNYNAQNQIWSIKTAASEQAFTDTQQSALDTIQGENEMAAGEMNATGTLLSTAATVASLGYKGSTVNPAGGGATLGSPTQMGTEMIMGVPQ